MIVNGPIFKGDIVAWPSMKPTTKMKIGIVVAATFRNCKVKFANQPEPITFSSWGACENPIQVRRYVMKCMWCRKTIVVL